MRRTALLSIAALFVAVGCGGSGSSSVTGTNNNLTGPMTATIDGKAWASPVPAAGYAGNIVSIAGLDLGLTASIALATGGVTGPGTYSLSYGNQLAGNATLAKSGPGWATALPGGTGTLVLTTATAHHVAGTFAFDAVPATGGATGTVHVTNGKFDITF